jgi:phage gpG-like protein
MANIVVEGLQEIQAEFKKFVFDMDKAIDDAVKITAFKVHNTAIESIREPSSSGNFVSRGTKRHEISKEGDTPNTDTGRLVGSIAVSHEKGSQVAFVGTNLDYGFFLETEMSRPWLEPAKNAEVSFFKNNIANAMDSQIKKAGK